MKKLVSLLTVAVFVLLASSLSYARGPFITPGARATGYGTAFVSIADDLTAIYWNPAGLAYQKSTQMMLSSYYVSASATSNDISGNPTKYETSAIIPFLGFATPLNKTTTLAFGMYASGGGGGKISNPETFFGPGSKVEGEQSFMIYNISVAKKINDKLSVGIGVEGVEMRDKLVYKIPFYAIDVDYSRGAFGFQGNIGIIYKPVEKLSTGFILRSGTYISLPKELNSSFVDGYTYPMTMELGASYNVSSPLTVAFAVAHNKYSWTSSEYNDTFQFRIGTEYKATKQLSLHLGFFTDPNIYKNSSSYMITNIDMYNMNYLCIGAGYNITESMKLGLTYTHSFTQDVVNNNITYQYPIDMGRFDISCKF